MLWPLKRKRKPAKCREQWRSVLKEGKWRCERTQVKKNAKNHLDQCKNPCIKTVERLVEATYVTGKRGTDSYLLLIKTDEIHLAE